MKLSLRARILIIPLIIIIVFVAFSVWFATSTNRSIWDEELSKVAKSQYDIYNNTLKNIAYQALTVAALVADAPGVEKAYEVAYTGDEKEARLQLRQTFDRIHKKVTDTLKVSAFKIHFHLPPAKSFLRIWRKSGKKDGGDDISSFRNTVLKVNRDQTAVQGIEIGRGGFVVRGLVPVTSSTGKHLGSVESLIDFNLVCTSSRLTEADQLAAFMNTGELNIATQLKG